MAPSQSVEEKTSLDKQSASKQKSIDGGAGLQPTPTKQLTITKFFNEPKPDKKVEHESETKKQSTAAVRAEKRKKTSGKENKQKTVSSLDSFVTKKSKAEVVEQKD